MHLDNPINLISVHGVSHESRAVETRAVMTRDLADA